MIPNFNGSFFDKRAIRKDAEFAYCPFCYCGVRTSTQMIFLCGLILTLNNELNGYFVMRTCDCPALYRTDVLSRSRAKMYVQDLLEEKYPLLENLNNGK